MERDTIGSINKGKTVRETTASKIATCLGVSADMLCGVRPPPDHGLQRERLGG